RETSIEERFFFFFVQTSIEESLRAFPSMRNPKNFSNKKFINILFKFSYIIKL
ncbi:unnamed protein product, partial [Arabidopsis halleri]